MTFEDVKVLAETDKAVLFRLDDDDEIWVPHSCIEAQGDDWVEIAEWFCKKKGIYP